MPETAKPDAPQRLDQFSAIAFQLSRNEAQAHIKGGFITVNGKSAKPGLTVQETDCIEFNKPESIQNNRVADLRSLPPLELLYEDAHIIVLNKPVDVVVHTANAYHGPTLVDQLLEAGITLAQAENNTVRPGIVHRLDRYTEGLMIVAKTDVAFENLKAQFKDRSIVKEYYVLVQGDVREDSREIESYIGRHPKKRHKRAVLPPDDPDAKEAITHLFVEKRFRTQTLCRVVLKTGRTHQIRLHCQHIGHPVIGDPVYADKPGKGQRLQAFKLGFTHPVTGSRMTFTMPISNLLLGNT